MNRLIRATNIFLLLLFGAAFIWLPGIKSFAQDNSAQNSNSSEDLQPSHKKDVSLKKGISRGIYYWSDLKPGTFQALDEFNIDVVVFRLGTLCIAQVSDSKIDYCEKQSISKQDFPDNLRYRAVLETNENFWKIVKPAEFAKFLKERVFPDLLVINDRLDCVEIKLPRNIFHFQKIAEFLKSLKELGLNKNVSIGAYPEFFSPGRDFGFLSTAEIHSLVVYILDFDFTGISPRITDSTWSDSVSARVNALGIPFVAVLPIYNRALLYTQGNNFPEILPALDLEKIGAVSDIHLLGAAGTEYRIKEALKTDGYQLKAGDRVLVLESIKQLNITDVYQKMSSIAPGCFEIDIFRLPLVPGFDPSAQDAFKASGLISNPTVSEISTDATERKNLDQKYYQGQQFIMILTMVMMAFLLMRIMSKGAPRKPSEGDGGNEAK